MTSNPGRALMLLPALLVACEGDGLKPYYGNGKAPEVSGLDVSSERGNLGGGTVTIEGSGFGNDPTLVSVVFGSQNAQIVSVTDSAITVRVPRGPIRGGAVDLVVGTPTGQTRVKDAYTYDLGDMYSDEIAYLAVDNDYYSCYAGVGDDIASFCQSSAYTGFAGVDGLAEFLAYVYPRVHTPYSGQLGGFGGTFDESWGQWTVEQPAQQVNTFDLQDSYEDLRTPVSGFSLVNPALADRQWCQDMTPYASWTYGGGTDSAGNVYSPLTLHGSDYASIVEDAGGACDQPYEQLYTTLADANDTTPALATMNFCAQPAYQDTTLTYESSWPVGDYFFVGEDEDGRLSADVPATVELMVPDAHVDVQLTLPEYAHFEVSQGLGFQGLSDKTQWALMEFQGDCHDSDGDGVVTSEDEVLSWQWKPTTAPSSVGGAVTDQRTFVRATIQYLSLGWFGGESDLMKATITVPDDWNYDESTGLSTLSVPASVLWQFPSMRADMGPRTDQFGQITGFTWGDPEQSDYGYMIITLQRVTEFRIDAQTSDQKGGLIFAYSTGDVGFYLWNNPQDRGTCDDCADNDGDGWIDSEDADCVDGENEDGTYDGDYECSDGQDNDRDGLVDAEDPNCTSGTGTENNCSDGIDNDGDGLIDAQDGECASGSAENGNDDPNWQCIDGIDNDGDGWTDFDDPDCTDGAADEVGFGTTQCNDGIDNDGHGDIDASDPYCYARGASEDTEQPSNIQLDCADGIDNDGDGYTDENDPDCEVSPYAYENKTSRDPSTDPTVKQCYDGIDNDGDGLVDAADPGCINPSTNQPDGFLDDEAADAAADTGTGGSSG